MSDGRIPIVLGIDVEPDNRHDPPGAGVEVEGFRRTVEVLQAMRPEFEASTGAAVRYAWFVRMDPQVAAQGGRTDAILAAAPNAIEEVQAEGDVIGLHTHAGRWDEDRARWVTDLGDAAWVDHCLEISFAAYRERLGEGCREHRFGDRFSSLAVYRRVEELGAQVDLTDEPGQRGRRRPEGVELATGRIPTYARAERSIHRLDGGSLMIIPLSAADPARAMPMRRRWLRRVRYLGQPRHRTLILDRAWPSPELFWDLAEGQLDSGVSHLAFVIRSDLVLHERWRGALAMLEALPRRALASRLAFVSGDGAVELAGR
jgi:hypothetical protein